MMNDEVKEARRGEIHVTDLTGCLLKAYLDKVSPAPEYIHETLARWLGTNFHSAAEGSDAVLDSELPLSWNGIVGKSDIVYKDGRVVDYKFCQPAGELVQMADGTEKNIEDIKIFDQVLAWDGEGFRPERVTAVMNGGVQEVFELKIASGQVIRASGNHPILTDRGFIPMKDLVVTLDRVKVLKHWTGEASMSLDDARLLGYFVGDGNTTQDYCTNIASTEPEIQEDVEAICESKGWGMSEANKRNGIFQYLRIHNGEKRLSATGPMIFLKTHDLFKKHAWEKSVPTSVMKGDISVISNFLAGLFDTDGTITDPESNIPARVSFSTTSFTLARQVSELCRRINVSNRVYKLYPTCNGRLTRPAYQVQIWQADSILTFGTLVPFRAGKKRARFETWKPILVKKLSRGEKNLRRVETLKSLGVMQTIGLEIEHSHTYISNGIVTHNTRWMYVNKLPYGSHSTQVNIYAWMLRKMGREVNRLQIQYVDASGPTKCRKCRVPVRAILDESGGIELKCPKCGNFVTSAHLGAYLVDIPLWTDEEVEDMILEKKENLEAALAMNMPPEAEPGFLCAYCSHRDVSCFPDVTEE